MFAGLIIPERLVEYSGGQIWAIVGQSDRSLWSDMSKYESYFFQCKALNSMMFIGNGMIGNSIRVAGVWDGVSNPIGSIVFKGWFSNTHVPIGIKFDGSIPIIEVEYDLRGDIDNVISWEVNEKDVPNLITDDYWLSFPPLYRKAEITQIVEEVQWKHPIYICGVATSDFVNALRFALIDEHLPDEEFKECRHGHFEASRTYTILGKKIQKYWTVCKGSGYRCSYSHPSGVRVLE